MDDAALANQLNRLGVQPQAIDAERTRSRTVHHAFAMRAVAHQRMRDVLEVTPDLVAPAGERLHFHQ